MKKFLVIIFLFKYLVAMTSQDSVSQNSMPDAEAAMPVAQDVQLQSVPQSSSLEPSQPSQQLPSTYDQLKWPDSIELNEGQSDIIKNDDPKIVECSKKASQLADRLKNLADKLKEIADKTNQEFTRINSLLDDFYQKIGFEEGKLDAMLK